MRLKQALAACALMLAGSILSAQAQAPAGQTPGGSPRGAPQPPPTNLQVLPKDTPRAEVVARMQTITQALGVTCAYCHKFEGLGNPANDFVSDDKATKTVARVMMRMTGDITRSSPPKSRSPRTS